MKKKVSGSTWDDGDSSDNDTKPKRKTCDMMAKEGMWLHHLNVYQEGVRYPAILRDLPHHKGDTKIKT